MPSSEKVSFIPTTAGNHGSRALWPQFNDSEAYWEAIEAFLAPWLVSTSASPTSLTLSLADSDTLRFSLGSAPGNHLLIQVSNDLQSWRPISSLSLTENESSITFTDQFRAKNQRFYQAVKVAERAVADVINVSVCSNENAYNFSVRVSSPDKGCDQYADWWEILREDGDLVYRRVLLHSHVSEQTFTRSGGTVNIGADEIVWIRAHTNNSGYGGQIYQGSVNTGFNPASQSPMFAYRVGEEALLPDGCDF
ncbi:MAG: hypothetical protein ACI8T1_000673 [Verrucomicrobiales bacterium]|jgi:hypothetical protein